MPGPVVIRTGYGKIQWITENNERVSLTTQIIKLVEEWNHHLDRVNGQLKPYEEKEYIPSHTDIQDRINKTPVGPSRTDLEQLLTLLSKREDLLESIRFATRKTGRILRSESEIADSAMKSGDITTLRIDENVGDVTGAEPVEVSAGRSITYISGQDGALSLDGFLSRPVSIFYDSIALGSNKDVTLSVWDLYSKVPAIRAKLRNFAYIRANLKVRISVSGTPFHYGRLLLSPQPTPLANAALTNMLAEVAINANYRPLLINYLSQAEGSSLINVSENKPVELTFPFISTKPMHRLFNDTTTSIAAATSFADLQYAAYLYIYSVQPCKAVSATPTSLYMQVYAWMEDVEVGVPTATQLVITTESKKGKVKVENREDVKGPVETFASRAKEISDALKNVPAITPFATATSMAAGTLEYIASLLGWSKPVLNNLPKRVKNEPFINGAQTIGVETLKKIVLDPQQETCIDASSLATNTDDMMIGYIANRKSLVTSFAWNDNDMPFTPIFSTAVVPTLVTAVTDVTASAVFSQPTAMAFATHPFTFWRGDIIFEFDVVCSAFHRGKLAILFEPNLAQFTTITTSLSMHKQYVKIIDIQETQTFEVRVNWASYRAWLKVISATASYMALKDPSYATYLNGFANGFISVIPFTELQSPDDSDISVNVFVRSDNLMVNGLSTANLPTSRKLLAESDVSSHPSTMLTTMDLNRSSADSSWICEPHFGERPISFRALLKRFVIGQQYTFAAGGASLYNWLKLNGPIFPANLCAFGATSVNNWDLFSYLRYAYLGVRGSVRKRIRFLTNTTIRPLEKVIVNLDPPSTSNVSGAVTTGSTLAYYPDLNGGVSFVPNTNGGIEVEFPLYSNNLHLQPALDQLLSTTDTGANETTFYRNYTVLYESTTAWASGTAIVENAAGDDFSFLRFQGAPFYTGGIVA